MKVRAMETVTWSQNPRSGLQKLGSAVCRIPVRFRLVTPEEADPALIVTYENTCKNKKDTVYALLHFSYFTVFDLL